MGRLTPTSLEQAEIAQKLARTALEAWRVAFTGRDVPTLIAEPLRQAIDAGDLAVGFRLAQRRNAAPVAEAREPAGNGPRRRETDVRQGACWSDTETRPTGRK